MLVYDEPFTPVRGFAFACIWLAVGLYSVDLLRLRPGAALEIPDAGT